MDAEHLQEVLDEWIGNGAWGIIADTVSHPVQTLVPWPLKEIGER